MSYNIYVILIILLLAVTNFANLAVKCHPFTLLSCDMTLFAQHNILCSHLSVSVTCIVLYLRDARRDVSAVIKGPSRLSGGSQGRSGQ